MNESRLAALFAEYLDAADQGRDIVEELLGRAGDERAALEARIELERKLRGLSRECGEPSIGTPATLGRFQVVQLLGQGGISRVFLAFDPDLGRRIALKVLENEFLFAKGQWAWIVNEARSLARISHPGVVRVYEVGEAQGHAYVAMEHLSGPSLHEVIGEWRRLRGAAPSAQPPAEPVRALAARLEPFSARTEVLARLAEALAHCHEHGILHRDIKPANVLFDADGTPKLIDFGLAHVKGSDEDSRLGLTRALVGTAAYIAPEQIASERTGADPRSDQFSFATLAYECLALANPFLRKTRRETLDAIEAAVAAPLRRILPGLPVDLALVIHHALEREPAARYPDMMALASDLRAVLAHRPILVQQPSLAHLARLWLRRHRRGVTVACAAVGTALSAWTTVEITGAWQEHRAVLEVLAEIQPATFASAEGFVRSSAPLEDLQRRARRLDGRILARALLPPTLADVQTTVESWSRALSECFAQELARGAATGIPVQDGVFRELFWQEAELCPECPFNRENRLRGRVLVPERVLRQGHALDVLCSDASVWGQLTTVFRPAPMVELLVSATYRLQVWEEGAERVAEEIVFYVPPGWNPAQRIEPHAPRQDCLVSTRLVERGTCALSEDVRRTVPRFRVLDHLVTVAEFARCLAETGLPPLSTILGSQAGDDGHAAVPLNWALAYCRWAGGRLPFRDELILARELGIQPSPAEAANLMGELVLDIGPDGGTVQVRFDDDGEPRLMLVQRERPMSTGDHKTPGFRVVFPADSPALYRELAEESLEQWRVSRH